MSDIEAPNLDLLAPFRMEQPRRALSTWRHKRALKPRTLTCCSQSCSNSHKYAQTFDPWPSPLPSPFQAAPLLKETLNDINWKDLEALRKIDAGWGRAKCTLYSFIATHPQTTF